MNGILGLFNIFSLLYLFRSLQLLNKIRQQWHLLKIEPLTAVKQSLAEQASFFVAVPPGVLVHEFGHALAVWLFGGQVLEFGYRVFWGYVVPGGSFSTAEDWFISLAGTLGSLIFGVAIWLFLRNQQISSFRFFGLRSFRFQIYFALIYYPLFTLFLPVGDWKTIYNFNATPLLSGITAVCHATLLLLFYRADRIGWFELPAFESMETAVFFQDLADHLAHSLTDINHQLQYIDSLRQGGTPNKARHALNAFIRQNPHVPAAYLQRAALNSGHNLSKNVANDVEKALQLGLSQPNQLAYAHQTLGRYYLERGEAQTAVSHFSQAIGTAVSRSENSNQATTAWYYHWRGQAYRRLQQFDAAFKDIQQAIKIADTVKDDKLLSHFRNELSIIENHAGRSFTEPPREPYGK
jgi:tetratricopeptide (TPR) repeat protein